jgi:hypothetical protein
MEVPKRRKISEVVEEEENRVEGVMTRSQRALKTV